jgi:hypothetical protein
MSAPAILLCLSLPLLAAVPRLEPEDAKAWPQLEEQAASLKLTAPEVPEVRAAPVQAGPRPSARTGGSASVMLQGFHWLSWKTSPWWGVVSAKARDIAAAGFDLVWLPPSADAESDEGYIPRRLYVQDSKYGTAAELKRAVSALHSGGVKVLADVVINHRVGTNGWAGFTEPAWGCEAVVAGDE